MEQANAGLFFYRRYAQQHLSFCEHYLIWLAASFIHKTCYLMRFLVKCCLVGLLSSCTQSGSILLPHKFPPQFEKQFLNDTLSLSEGTDVFVSFITTDMNIYTT